MGLLLRRVGLGFARGSGFAVNQLRVDFIDRINNVLLNLLPILYLKEYFAFGSVRPELTAEG